MKENEGPIDNKKLSLQESADKYVTEYMKCKAEFDYFCRNYIYLELPGKDIKFKPYGKQVELINLIEAKKYVLVLKSRQIGISTIIQAYAVWLCNFYDNVSTGIVSKDGAEATHFARTIRTMYEKLPNWMKPPGGQLGRGFAKRAEQSFILTNGSKIYASPVNPNAPEKTLRGKALTFLIIDEAAFVNHIDSAWTSMVPALSTNQMQAKKAGVPYGTIVLSTPNKTVGSGEWYFRRYQSAVSRDDIFEPFVIHWKSIPELADDPDWYKNQCSLFNNDPRKIAQELELKFLPAEGSFFDADVVERVQAATCKPIERNRLFNGELWKFKQPIPGKYYLTGVDTAAEHGNDKSAITVWDYETMEQVAEYCGKCKVLDFVKVVKAVITLYQGMVVIESNSYGNQVVEQLVYSEFGHMVYKERRGRQTVLPGLSNNSKTRPLMIDAFYSYITQFSECVKSERLALEIAGLVTKKSGRVEADSGCHDDLVMSTSCAMYVRKYDPPLLIGTQEHMAITADIMEIMGINNNNRNDGFQSDEIIKRVKDDNMSGFIDIMNFYDRK